MVGFLTEVNIRLIGLITLALIGESMPISGLFVRNKSRVTYPEIKCVFLLKLPIQKEPKLLTFM